jgi:hypothetical protein
MYGLFFETEEELVEYMEHPEYGKIQERPLLCAGISHSQGPGGPDDYQFKMHYNDWEEYYYA